MMDYLCFTVNACLTGVLFGLFMCNFSAGVFMFALLLTIDTLWLKHEHKN
jgi:hypothetical protein